MRNASAMSCCSRYFHQRFPHAAPHAVGVILQAILLVVSAAVPGRAEIIRTSTTSITFSGTSSIAGTPVSVRATLWYDPNDPDFLNLLLQNTSPAATDDPVGLLTSFYFGVYSGTTSGTPPTLAVVSGSGQVVEAVKNGPDVPGVWTPPAVAGGKGNFNTTATGLSNLVATKKGDLTWQFRGGLSLVASEPPLNFGIGTVGNNGLGQNGFNGNIVGGNDFGISIGDATTQNLESVGLLVSGSALFRFSGFTGYSIANVPDHAVFGLGSVPDAMITVPETGVGGLVALGTTAALGLFHRRRRPSRGPQLTPRPSTSQHRGIATNAPHGSQRCSRPGRFSRSSRSFGLPAATFSFRSHSRDTNRIPSTRIAVSTTACTGTAGCPGT